MLLLEKKIIQRYCGGYVAGNRQVNRNSGVRQTSNVRNRQASNLNNRARTSNKTNNMYTDRSGNAYKRNQNGT